MSTDERKNNALISLKQMWIEYPPELWEIARYLNPLYSQDVRQFDDSLGGDAVDQRSINSYFVSTYNNLLSKKYLDNPEIVEKVKKGLIRNDSASMISAIKLTKALHITQTLWLYGDMDWSGE